MILRKLADAIREQNWFTVTLEILIVVIGIFLGLQVTEWNEDRQDRALEREYLVRIAQNLDRDYDNLSAGLEDTIFRHQEAQYLINSEDFEAIDPCHFIFAAFTSTFFGLPSMNRQTYDEVVSSGKLTLLTSHALKEAIGRYYAYEVQLNRTHDISHVISNNVYAAHVPYVSIEWSRMGADIKTIEILLKADSLDDYPATCDMMPMDKIVERHTLIWQKPELWGWFGPVSGMQAVNLEGLTNVLQLNRAARRLISIELGEPISAGEAE